MSYPHIPVLPVKDPHENVTQWASTVLTDAYSDTGDLCLQATSSPPTATVFSDNVFSGLTLSHLIDLAAECLANRRPVKHRPSHHHQYAHSNAVLHRRLADICPPRYCIRRTGGAVN